MLFKIAFRNIFRQKRRSFLTGIVLSVGFICMACVFGMFDGVYGGVIELFTSHKTGHIQIHAGDYLDSPSLYKTLSESGENANKLLNHIKNDSNIRSFAPRIYAGVMAFKDKKTAGIQLIGIDPELEDKMTHISKTIEQGGQYFSEQNSLGKTVANPPIASPSIVDKTLDNSPIASSSPTTQPSPSPNNKAINKQEVILSNGAATALSASVGDKVIFLSQAADGTVANDIFTVIGVQKNEISPVAIVHLATAQNFLQLYGRIHEFSLITASYKVAKNVAESLQQKIDNPMIDVQSWQAVEPAFYKAMKTDMAGAWVLMGILMFIMALAVLNAILMSVLERKKEFGLLKALGTTPQQIFALILLENIFLSAIVFAATFPFSFAFNLWLTKHGILYEHPIELGGIAIDRAVASIAPHVFIFPACFIFMTVIIVSIFPALCAAKTIPIKAMRAV